MDASDLSSCPLTLRTLRQFTRDNNTREVNRGCIFCELRIRPNQLNSK
jgi:hypothetical protein